MLDLQTSHGDHPSHTGNPYDHVLLVKPSGLPLGVGKKNTNLLKRYTDSIIKADRTSAISRDLPFGKGMFRCSINRSGWLDPHFRSDLLHLDDDALAVLHTVTIQIPVRPDATVVTTCYNYDN